MAEAVALLAVADLVPPCRDAERQSEGVRVSPPRRLGEGDWEAGGVSVLGALAQLEVDAEPVEVREGLPLRLAVLKGLEEAEEDPPPGAAPPVRETLRLVVPKGLEEGEEDPPGVALPVLEASKVVVPEGLPEI